MNTTIQRCIGTKLVLAEAMTRADYNAFRGWTLPVDENGEDAGYLVEYQDGGKPNLPGRTGYVSWTPKEQFDSAYRPCAAMTFGLALEALKRGQRVARAGWNGAGQWVALGGGQHIAPDEFWSPHTQAFAQQKADAAGEGEDKSTFVRPYFILKTAQDDILMGWSPSQSDALAEDWLIVE